MKPSVNAFWQAVRCLTVLLLVFHVTWLPVHLLTAAHCDSSPAHDHAQAHADHHGHSHGESNSHHQDGDTDHHHLAGDHESKFLSKRQALLFAPTLVTWQQTLLMPVFSVAIELPVSADPAPPPADFFPPSGPRAPPLA